MVSRLSFFTILIILLQSLLLLVSLIFGGVLKQSRENVYSAFRDKVVSRTNYIQSEMDNRWTNLEYYVKELSAQMSTIDFNTTKIDRDQFLYDVSNTLIEMLRSTGTTGSFLILNDNLTIEGMHHSVYIRDYDPQTNSENNEDLYLVYGPSSISKGFQIPLDRNWRYGILLDEKNSDFYEEPLKASKFSEDSMNLCYWSTPFSISMLDDPVITCSMPIFDQDKVVRGVIGVEISVAYFKKLLPSNEISTKDSLGYTLVLASQNSQELRPLFTKGGYQQRVVKENEVMTLQALSPEYNIFRLLEKNLENPIYTCVQPLNMYTQMVPYQKNVWSIMGFLEGDTLFEFVNLMIRIFFLSFAASLVLGMIGGMIISRKITKPIVSLAQTMQGHDFTKNIKLSKTGFTEIDGLVDAIEGSNRKLLNSTLKLSQIMDMVHIKIAAFEYSKRDKYVFVTNQLYDILNLERITPGNLLVNYDIFFKRLEELWKRKEPEEEDVYLAGCQPKQWVKINIIWKDDICLGVVQDVTEDIIEKHSIKKERDYDFLTQIYNRAAFQRSVEFLLQEGSLQTAALVMFDLDGLKQINDTYGHLYGDIYIRATAERLSIFPANRTILGRRSGDEFYVFFYYFSEKKEIEKELHLFYQSLSKNQILFPNEERMEIRISAGISWYQEDAFDYETLVNHADDVLYQVKQSEKGKFQEYLNAVDLD